MTFLPGLVVESDIWSTLLVPWMISVPVLLTCAVTAVEIKVTDVLTGTAVTAVLTSDAPIGLNGDGPHRRRE